MTYGITLMFDIDVIGISPLGLLFQVVSWFLFMRGWLIFFLRKHLIRIIPGIMSRCVVFSSSVGSG
jgi:hypothetical protein